MNEHSSKMLWQQQKEYKTSYAIIDLWPAIKLLTGTFFSIIKHWFNSVLQQKQNLKQAVFNRCKKQNINSEQASFFLVNSLPSVQKY